MAAVRAAGVEAFGVNLFVPGAPTAETGRARGISRVARPEAAALGATSGRGRRGTTTITRPRSRRVLAAPPAAVSFTFGLPEPEVVRALQDAGSLVLVTVTTPEEAERALRGRPRRALPAGRRGGGAPRQPGQRGPCGPGPAAACAAGRGVPPHPGAAGGGGRRGRPRRRRRPARRGARPWCSAGTAFLRCPESGAHPVAKDAPGRGGRSVAAPQLSPGPSAGAGPAPSSTPWCGTIRVRRRPTPRSTTPPARCAPPRPPAGDAGHMSLYAGTGFRAGRGAPRRRDRGAPGVGAAVVSEPTRETMTIEFRPPDVAAVADSLAKLRAAGERLDQPHAGHRRGGGRDPSRRPGSSRSSATVRRR